MSDVDQATDAPSHTLAPRGRGRIHYVRLGAARSYTGVIVRCGRQIANPRIDWQPQNRQRCKRCFPNWYSE